MIVKANTVRTAVLVAALVTACNTPLFAYEVATHEEMSEEAALTSSLPDYLFVIGQKTLDDKLEDIGTTNSIVRWIRLGAHDEDDTLSTNLARYRHHFFDPQHGGRGLVIATDTGEPSPDWALEDTRSFATQSYSFAEARQYFYDALTLPNDNREQWMARTFYTLGHVIHHIQDMAQPQHTRNDPHAGVIGFGARSRYENYIDLHRAELLFSDEYYNPENPVHFETARRFWISGDGQGMAEFSSHNFVSLGTNFRGAFQDSLLIAQPNETYPRPRPDPVTPTFEPAAPLLASVNKPVPQECAADPCGIAFYSSEVNDSLRPQAGRSNPRASTASMFDQDLERYGKSVPYPNLDRCAEPGNPETCEQTTTSQVFSLNSFNFDAASEFLIPRAVAYSAGLIDYFFRGRLEAEDVEFTATGLRLRVKNAIDAQETPAWKDEVLYADGGSGTLVLAYEYKDGNGTTRYGVSPVVSLTSNLRPGETSSAHYDFAVSVPAEGREVKYRLVFRGRLGQEDNAVAVGTADGGSGFIVTPNYLPEDGISGNRVIANIDGQWRTLPFGGAAGNIDWKGGYRNGKATHVLTWWGPKSRYFGPGMAPTLNEYIYKDGQVFARAPGPVYGAAVARDANGAEWLLAVSFLGGDVLLRRPFERSDSDALYDPVTSPRGWQVIAEFDHIPWKRESTPWFFNSTGTEAQAVIRQEKFLGYDLGGNPRFEYLGLTRWKIEMDINAPSATRYELGNNPGIQNIEEVQLKIDPPFCGGDSQGRTYPAYEVRSMNRSGSYVIAVDYKRDQEVLAVLSDDRSSSIEIRVEGTRCEQRTTDLAIENAGELRLRVGDRDIVLEKNHWHKTKHEAITYNWYYGIRGEVQHEEKYSFEQTRIHFMDLRYNLVIVRQETRDFEASLAGAIGGGTYPRKSVPTTEQWIYELRSDIIDKQASSDQSQGSASLGDHYDGQVIQAHRPPYSDYAISETRIPDINSDYDFRELISPLGGSVAVDSSGRLAVSRPAPNGVFNYLSDGELTGLLPGAPTYYPRFYPIFVLR